MTDTKKNKTAQVRRNVVESLKGLGNDFGAQGADLLKSTSEDFFKELIGIKAPQANRSGEMTAGESVEMAAILSGKEEENKRAVARVHSAPAFLISNMAA